MINILLAGVGGQGNLVAAQVLAQAAHNKGWQVSTAETIGMAQRGGSVASHIRMGNQGESIHSPLIPQHAAHLIIAFDPAEGARALSYLAADGTLVSATSIVPIPSSTADEHPHRGANIIRQLVTLFGSTPDQLVIVPDRALLKRVGTKRTLNTALLASALATKHIPLTRDDLCEAIQAVVKPKYVDINLKTVDEVFNDPQFAEA